MQSNSRPTYFLSEVNNLNISIHNVNHHVKDLCTNPFTHNPIETNILSFTVKR